MRHINATHGFFFEPLEYEKIPLESVQSYELANGDSYQQVFIPTDNNFVGVALNLTGIVDNNSGRVALSIYDLAGKLVDTVSVEIEKITDKTWYPVVIGGNLHGGETYTLSIENQGCHFPPILQIIDERFLPSETKSGNLLLSYGYSKFVFTVPEKLLVSLTLLAILIGTICWILQNSFWKVFLMKFSLFLLFTMLLAWNYTFNFLDNHNSQFEKFQVDSESLVTGVILAEQNGVNADLAGLGRYQDMAGTLYDDENKFISDENWDCGYSRILPMLAVDFNPYTEDVCREGNYIKFENGAEIRIMAVHQCGNYLNIQLDAEGGLTPNIYGNLHNAEVLNDQKEILPKGSLYPYRSQFGLQGRVFHHIARYMDYTTAILALNFLCSVCSAAVFCLISIFLYKKYGGLLAGCFYIVFLLSPWIVNFARNLYWVEFTWFLPMATGLFCSIKISSKSCRILSYTLGWATIFIKSLCGYEYLTSIMLGMVIFLLTDWVAALIYGNKRHAQKIFFTILFLSISAIAGFVCALCLHGNMVGNGDIGEGIKIILRGDALRRTNGASLADFGMEVWPSINASVWEVVKMYFQFSTEILTGIQGNLFPLLCILPVICFIHNILRGKQNWKDVSLYVVSFMTSISWFILAKAHSYVHTHMNYVLWYFGFVQICIYILCKQVMFSKGPKNSASIKKE